LNKCVANNPQKGGKKSLAFSHAKISGGGRLYVAPAALRLLIYRDCDNNYLSSLSRKNNAMKDSHDKQTPDLLPTKRPRGRPATGKAMTAAERQAKYRAKVAQNNVTVTVNRGLLERLDAHMQELRDGSTAQILTPDEAGQVLEALRRAQMVQLKG
jgi:hypothetical protein